MRVVICLAGIVVLVGTTSSALRTLVVPRRLRSKLTSVSTQATLAVFRGLARATRDFASRDRLLAWAAPISILVTLAVWLTGYLVGYSLVLYGLSDLGVTAATREAGSSLFTLGFASSDRQRLTAVDFLAAATGPVIMGLLIGYLSAVYAAYNRREADVTMLDSRAGEPNWGPEILARHSLVSTTENLRELFRGWERWAADVSESHTNYPVLIFVRSPRPGRNWVVGLLAVMDAAALQLACSPSMPQGEARIAVRMGFVCLRDLAETLGIGYNGDPDPDSPIRLTYEQFLVAYERLRQADFPLERPPEQAWPHFRGWRVNYESIAYELASRVDAVPAKWSGPRRFTSEELEPQAPPNRQPRGQ